MLTGLLAAGVFSETLRGIPLPTRQAQRRRGLFRRYAFVPLFMTVPCDLNLFPLLLKLPVLTASKSLRRSRKAGAARMDAG
jgi:hypothetical protein